MEEEQQPAASDERSATTEYIPASRATKGEAETGTEVHQGHSSTTHTDNKAARRRICSEYANDKTASGGDRAGRDTRSLSLR